MIARPVGLALVIACACATAASAQADLFSPQTVQGLADLRFAVSDGEKSWVDGGYGKTAFSGDDGDLKATPELAEAALVWRPRFTWELGAVVSVQHQPEQVRAVDIVETYLTYKPVPNSDWRYSIRAGFLYPPISMEHEDPAWGVTHTITPSAIDSWVGEEVKTLAYETKVGRKFGDQEVDVTIAPFGYNDTAGTLLALRGWALDDIKTTLFGKAPLPQLLAQYRGIWRDQAGWTEPTRNLDGRIGYYGRLDWQTAGPVALNLFYYNNDGNRTAVKDAQWSWATWFWNAGASYDLDSRTRFLAQVMTGNTQEGYGHATPKGVWIDADFHSAYVLATRSYGKAQVTARVDWFDTVDYTYIQRDDNNEHGWAYTAAWRYDFSPKVTLLVEALHVTSGRLAREYIGVDPRQDQTVLQTSLRLRL